MDTANKVKYNLKNVHYAVVTFDSTGLATFGKPLAVPGAVSLSCKANGEPKSFYADGVEFYTVNNNQGYDGDLEIALIPESFRTDVLKEEADSNKVLVENANSQAGHFALLFEFDGDIKQIRHVLYNCSAARPSIDAKTNEETKTVQPDKLSIKARPLADGRVKAKTGDSTAETVFNSWYESVYEPKTDAAKASASTGK